MSAAEKLKALERGPTKVIPIFRKTGPKHEGADAFSRARDLEAIMDALPQIVAVVEAAEMGFTVVKNQHGVKVADGWAHAIPELRDALDALDEALS